MKLAVIDFDGTLFPKQTIPFLLQQWFELKYSKTKGTKIFLKLLPYYLIYKLCKRSKRIKEKFRFIALDGFNSIFEGMTKDEIINFFEKISKSIKKLLNPCVIKELRRVKESGYKTVLLSGAYVELLEYVSDELDFDYIIGSEIFFNENDVFNSKKDIDFISGSDKVNKLKDYFNKEQIDWKECYALADSITDLELLELVGVPVVVNPDQALKKIVNENNWKIINNDS